MHLLRAKNGLGSCDAGSTTIEFAFTAFLLFGLILGTIEFSLLFYQRGAIEKVVQDVARKAAALSTSPTRDADLDAYFQEEMKNYTLSNCAGGIKSEKRIFDGYQTIVSDPYAVSPTYGSSGEIIWLIGSCEYEFMTPFGSIMNLSLSNINLSSSAMYKIE